MVVKTVHSPEVNEAAAFDSLTQLLRDSFQLESFRKGQLEIIRSILAGSDTMAVMPTGGGKSLCYQLPALFHRKLVVVISPLIALMQDQVKALQRQGLRAGCLHSAQTDSEKREVFSRLNEPGSFLLYLSPERVQKPGFAAWLRGRDVALIAIDEAHCVSQWGPDFRQDYGKLEILRQIKPETPILALTATATPQVLNDIEASLQLRKPDRHVYGFYRPNLFYQVAICVDDDRKTELLFEAIRLTPEGRIIIYCGTRNLCETLSSQLAASMDGVGFYHAGLAAEVRSDVQAQLSSGKIRILCATNAFGMGIDLPNVRLVAHFQMPANIESFYQEVGRAGRDGKMSRCLLLYSKRDRSLQTFFIQQSKAEARVISSKWRALDAMTLFAEGGECRHAGILTYFRDSERIKSCGHCDICTPKSDWVVACESSMQKISSLAKVVTKTRKKSKDRDAGARLETAEAELRSECLREWRRTYAERNDIAAFIVFSNRTLIDLANRNPKDLSELAQVYGFGEHKVSTLGAEVLSELAKCEPSRS